VSAAEADVAGLPTDPGSRLRRQREQAGLTEQQVADQLNLDAVVVGALDRNDYSSLGAPVFVRGHIRRYATLVGADPAEVLAAYDRSRSGPGQPTLIPRAREEMQPIRTRQQQRPRVARLAIAVTAVLVVGAVGAWIATQGLRWPWAGAPGTTVAATTVDTPAPQVSASGAAAPGAAASAPATAVVPPAGRVSVLFSFSGDSWIEVYDAAGQTVLYDLGKAGTQRPVSGAAPLNVTLGNAPAVAMDVNGRRITLPVADPGGTVTHFEVGVDGASRKLQGDRP
jgi:cytoskeleton protein RodZ